jgi:hypothetical protein
MTNTWRMRVTGLVSRELDTGERVAVPTGDYTMREIDTEHYELTRDGGPTFTLSLKEVSRYLNTKDLKAEGGAWPS